MVYDKDRLEEREWSAQEIPKLLDDWPVVWVNVIGLGTESTLRAIAQVFRLHPLAFEDVVHVHRRKVILMTSVLRPADSRLWKRASPNSSACSNRVCAHVSGAARRQFQSRASRPAARSQHRAQT